MKRIAIILVISLFLISCSNSNSVEYNEEKTCKGYYRITACPFQCCEENNGRYTERPCPEGEYCNNNNCQGTLVCDDDSDCGIDLEKDCIYGECIYREIPCIED